MIDSPVVSLPSTRLPRWSIVAVVAVILALFAVRNLPWHLDDYDQAKQAFVSFEMLKDGDWWFQHTPTGRVATKPPLAGWISAGVSAATAQQAWNIAWRLPPLICGLIILWLLWRTGDRLGGTLGAVIAAGSFGFNNFSPRLSTLVRTDMMLALWIFLAGYLIYEKLRTERPWDARSRFCIFLVILASMLTKGPIAYAFLLPGLVAFWWVQRKSLDRGRAWSGWLSWFAPLLFFGLWVGIGIWMSREFYQQVVLDEFLGRFTVGEGAKHHNFGPHFYFLQILSRFMPWGAALIALAFLPPVRERLRREPAVLWLVCWALGGIIFMSLVPSKRPDRIFPAIPPLCLLLAAMVSFVPRGMIGEYTVRRLALITLAFAFVFSGGYATFRVIQGYQNHEGTLVDFGKQVRATADLNRLVVLNGKDEGMLLYARQTSFTKPSEAVELWNAGKIDAVIAPKKLLGELQGVLPQNAVALESVFSPSPEKNSSYVLLKRTAP